MKKFSVLSACHSKQPYIRDAYTSLLGQSYKNWEWIIVDDCSRDRSAIVINKLTKKDPRVHFYSNESRKKCSETYANCLSHADGRIWGVLDIDDILMPNAISDIVALYNKYPDISYIYSQHEICTHKMRHMRHGVSSLPPSGKSFADMAMEKVHCFSHFRTCRMGVTQPEVIFPAGLESCVDKHMGFILEEHGKGGFFSKVLYKYRWYEGNNLSTRLNTKKRVRMKDSQKHRWRRMALEFIEKRKVHSIETHPVIEVTL